MISLVADEALALTASCLRSSVFVIRTGGVDVFGLMDDRDWTVKLDSLPLGRLSTTAIPWRSTTLSLVVVAAMVLIPGNVSLHGIQGRQVDSETLIFILSP